MHFKSMVEIVVGIEKYVRPLKTKEPDQITLIRLRMERAKGIEPSLQAWEARFLPLKYTRLFRAGFRRPDELT